jgi:glycogen debranching enzyme
MIESLSAQALYGDMRLSRADILRTALLVVAQDGKIFHTSYSLLYVQMVKDYFWYTADFQTLQKVYPSIKAILNRFNGYIGKEGLVTRAPNYMFIDWVVEGDITYHHPPAELGLGAMSAFYYGALANAEALAHQLGDTLQAHEWSQQREELGIAFRKELWDEASGIYRPGISGICEKPMLYGIGSIRKNGCGI